MKRSIPLTLFLLTALVCMPKPLQAAPMKVCLNSSDGKILIKRRCKASKGQTEVNAETLQDLGASQTGPQGSPGLSEFERVRVLEEDKKLSGNATFGLFASCPEDKTLIGGGCFGVVSEFSLSTSAPSEVSSFPNAWRCDWKNRFATISSERDFVAYAFCAKVLEEVSEE